MNGLRYWYDSLAPRERLLLTGGAAVVLVCGCILLLVNAWQTRQSLLTGRAIVSAELDWMEEQAMLLGSMEKHCATLATGGGTPESRLRALADRYGIDVSALGTSAEGSYQLQLNAAEGNAVLAFAHDSVCEGFRLDGLTVTETDSQDSQGSPPVSATLELMHGN